MGEEAHLGRSRQHTHESIREVYPEWRLVAVEPAESPLMSGGEAGTHGIYGIGDGFIPAIAGDGNGGAPPAIDEVVCVESHDAKDAAHYLCAAFAGGGGISAGANFLAARRVKERYDTVVTILPDGFQKYRSKELVHRRGDCPFEHELVV